MCRVYCRQRERISTYQYKCLLWVCGKLTQNRLLCLALLQPKLKFISKLNAHSNLHVKYALIIVQFRLWGVYLWFCRALNGNFATKWHNYCVPYSVQSTLHMNSEQWTHRGAMNHNEIGLFFCDKQSGTFRVFLPWRKFRVGKWDCNTLNEIVYVLGGIRDLRQ